MSAKKSEIDLWFSDWFPISSHSKLLDKICKGPMKTVLTDFLVIRAKTDAYIDFVRSNLYIHKQKVQDQRSVSLKDRQIHVGMLLSLRNEEQELLHTVKEKVDQLYKFDMFLCSFNAIMEKKLLIKNLRDSYTNTCNFLIDLHSLHNISEERNSNSDELLKVLDGLYEDTSVLFHSIFLQNTPVDPSHVDWNKIEAIIPSVLCGPSYSKKIQHWIYLRHRESYDKIQKLNHQSLHCASSNLISQWSPLISKKLFRWNQAHVESHFQNVGTQKVYKTMSRKKQDVQLREIQKCRYTTGLPVELLSLIRREELKGQLRRCREILNLESVNIWDKPAPYNVLHNESNPDSSEDEYYFGKLVTERSTKSHIQKSVAIEDVAVCLFRGWGATKARLLATRDRVGQTIPDHLFPALAMLSEKERSFDNVTRGPMLPSRCAIASTSRGSIDFEGDGISKAKMENLNFLSAATNMDLNPLMDLQESLSCGVEKQGSSVSDVIRDLIAHTTNSSSAIAF